MRPVRVSECSECFNLNPSRKITEAQIRLELRRTKVRHAFADVAMKPRERLVNYVQLLARPSLC